MTSTPREKKLPSSAANARAAATRRPAKRQARRKLSHRFQSRLKRAPRRIVFSRPGARTFSLTLLLACAWLVFLFATSDLFYIENVVVEGNSTVPAEDVVKASDALYLNVFYLEFAQVEKNVRALNAVQDAHASYEWPNTVRITLAERKPVFVWESNKISAWVDEAGQIFPARSALTHTLIIRDLDNQPRSKVDPRLIVSAQTLMQAYPNVTRVDYSDAKGLSFVDERGWRVMLGQPDQFSAKLAMLQSLSSYLSAQRIEAEYIDVRLPERAFYKPK